MGQTPGVRRIAFWKTPRGENIPIETRLVEQATEGRGESERGAN